MNLIKRLFTSVIAGSLIVSSSVNHVKASDREVRIYSGRHYNTDKQIYKKFAEETGIKIRLIEATGISLVERLKREGANSKADVILLVDAARISNAAKSGLLQSYRYSELDKNHLLDLSTALTYHAKQLELKVGYRSFKTSEYTIQGPELSLGYWF